ncbi:MAG: UvrD-helicase domain-containing protein, partial [Lachnospiraceae bacterium]|nr:UvrD-helicase domain-containing protein [Lachnospiraceae bacterium]
MLEQIGNEAQHRAISHGAGAMLVLAGPGSGKTFVVTQRVKYLIEHHHVRPEDILVITFTKAAATEMQERFGKLSGGRNYPVHFGTFHSVFFQILRHTYRFTAQN